MLNKILLIIIMLSVSVVSWADAVTVNPDHPETYTVQKGDTLWGITGKFLKEPWLWPQVWEANPQIENPHLIYPGDVVSLQYKDGRPILAVNRGDKSGRYERLSPSIRSYEKDNAIPAIPIDAIKQFLSRPLVVTDTEMDDLPYVVSSFDQHLIAGSGNKIYARGIPEDSAAKTYAIYRKGKAYINPLKDDKTVLGYEALHVGDVVLDKSGDPATFTVARSNREVLVGDRLVEESESDVNTNFVPTKPYQSVNGTVLSVMDGVAEIGQYQVVVLDLGTKDGMETGNILGIYQSGNEVNDSIATAAKAQHREPIKCQHEDTNVVEKDACKIINDLRETKEKIDQTDLVGYLGRPGDKPEVVKLPEEYVGVLMLFRTFENISYALVMEAQGPIHIYDTVRNL